jgi:hypothetical protein
MLAHCHLDRNPPVAVCDAHGVSSAPRMHCFFGLQLDTIRRCICLILFAQALIGDILFAQALIGDILFAQALIGDN